MAETVDGDEMALVDRTLCSEGEASDEADGDVFEIDEEIHCYLCDIVVTGLIYPLASWQAEASKQRLVEKLGYLVGERYEVVIDDDDILCGMCVSDINSLDRLEKEALALRENVLNVLETKYDLAKGELVNQEETGLAMPPRLPVKQVGDLEKGELAKQEGTWLAMPSCLPVKQVGDLEKEELAKQKDRLASLARKKKKRNSILCNESFLAKKRKAAPAGVKLGNFEKMLDKKNTGNKKSILNYSTCQYSVTPENFKRRHLEEDIKPILTPVVQSGEKEIIDLTEGSPNGSKEAPSSSTAGEKKENKSGTKAGENMLTIVTTGDFDNETHTLGANVLGGELHPFRPLYIPSQNFSYEDPSSIRMQLVDQTKEFLDKNHIPDGFSHLVHGAMGPSGMMKVDGAGSTITNSAQGNLLLMTGADGKKFYVSMIPRTSTSSLVQKQLLTISQHGNLETINLLLDENATKY